VDTTDIEPMDTLDTGPGNRGEVVHLRVDTRVDSGQELGRLPGLPVYPEPPPPAGRESGLSTRETGQGTLSIEEAALALALSQKTIRRMIHRGELPAAQAKAPGGQRQYRIPRAAVDALARADRLDGIPRVDSPPPAGGTHGVDCGETPGTPRPPAEGGQGRRLAEADSAEVLSVQLALLREQLDQAESQLAAARAELDVTRERSAELGAENARLHALASERAGEIVFLRERVVAAETAAEQQRILALRTCEALERAQVQLALPPPAPPPRRRWWSWRRRDQR
jgi:excisionase family DNA binding protein